MPRKISIALLILLIAACIVPNKSPERTAANHTAVGVIEPIVVTLKPENPLREETTRDSGSSGTDSKTTSTQLPEYLPFVIPESGSRYSLCEYRELAPSLRWNATEPGVCVSISPIWLLEPGDFPTTQEWLAQMYLQIDDQVITEPHSLLETDSFGFELYDPETGKVVGREPDGTPFRVCYSVPLGPGLHTATLVVTKTSGEKVSYSWDFLIVE